MPYHCLCLVCFFAQNQTEYFSSVLRYFSSQAALLNPYIRYIVKAKQVPIWRDGFGGCDNGAENAAKIFV